MCCLDGAIDAKELDTAKELVIEPGQAASIMIHTTKILHFIVFHTILVKNRTPRVTDIINILLCRCSVLNEIGGHEKQSTVLLACLPDQTTSHTHNPTRCANIAFDATRRIHCFPGYFVGVILGETKRQFIQIGRQSKETSTPVLQNTKPSDFHRGIKKRSM